MANYITLNAVPRTPWAEEALLVSGTVVQLDATKAEGSLLIRARLEGGPIRFLYTEPPSSTVGVPLFNGDVVEWAGPEIHALATTGGMILGTAAVGAATLWVVYYR